MEAPVRITLSIANTQDALEYYLSMVVFRENVKVKSVKWDRSTDNFVIDFERAAAQETK